MSSLLECEVVTEIEAGAHTLFVANVIGAKVLSENAPMTYDYYLNVKNGVTPPKAVSYTENERKGFRCPICGYIHESDDLPNDFACPICGAPGSLFEKINN
jgi:rubrerythrin